MFIKLSPTVTQQNNDLWRFLFLGKGKCYDKVAGLSPINLEWMEQSGGHIVSGCSDVRSLHYKKRLHIGCFHPLEMIWDRSTGSFTGSRCNYVVYNIEHVGKLVRTLWLGWFPAFAKQTRSSPDESKRKGKKGGPHYWLLWLTPMTDARGQVYTISFWEYIAVYSARTKVQT